MVYELLVAKIEEFEIQLDSKSYIYGIWIIGCKN